MAAKAPTTAAAAAPEADASSSFFSLPNVSVPDVTAPSPSQALVKAGDILTATVATISTKAGQALEIFGNASRHHYPRKNSSLYDGACFAGIVHAGCFLMTSLRHRRRPSRISGLRVFRALPQPEDQGVFPRDHVCRDP